MMTKYIDCKQAQQLLINDNDFSAVELLDHMPAADVVEVRRGEWIKDEWSLFYPRYNCSVCGCIRLGEPTKFCPDCGADMRGNNNDNRTEN
jgi:rubrerythrin